MASPLPQTTSPQVPAFPRFAPTASRLTAGGLIGRTFEVWWKNLGRFSLIALLVYLPLIAAAGATFWSLFRSFRGRPEGAPPGPGDLTGFWATFGVAGVVAMLLAFAAVAAYTYGTIQYLSGKPVRVGALLSAGARRAIPVLFAGLLVGVAVGGGLVLLIVPGIIFGCGLFVTIPAVVVEREGVFAALGRSWRLTSGQRLAIFGAGVALLAINWMATFAAQLAVMALPHRFAPVGTLFSAVVSFVLSSLPAVIPAVAYHDLRVQKEGVATEDLLKVFE